MYRVCESFGLIDVLHEYSTRNLFKIIGIEEYSMIAIMDKKIVVRVSMNDDKSRSKALKISVGLSGVESAALTGQEKDQVEVVGEGIDAVELTRQLRKNVAHAELVSVGEVKKEETTAAKAEAPTLQPAVVWSYAPPYGGYQTYPVYEMRAPCHDPSCVIM
ncbi:hypothetical protein DH2020_011358 [Rehmannia glutinosa]|uniref:HMA domain-containing protein n=1 Tax=Rehmannia glutinosa TaxID=99300 RepID=A0ABR0XD42_REHGL